MPPERRSKIMVRPPIRPKHPTQLNHSEDVDGNEISIKAHDDSSGSINTSNEIDIKYSSEEDSFKADNRYQKSLSSPSSFQHSSFGTEESKYKTSYNDKSEAPNKGYLILVILAPVVVLGGIFFYYLPKNNESYCEFKTLCQENIKQDDNIWCRLSSGIDNIKQERSEKPGVYLFVAKDGSKMRTIVQNIATQTSQCLRSDLQLIYMTEDDFTSPSTMEDYGNAIEIFKEKIKNGRVAIINLNEIPAESARALHTICDTYSPVANDIVIYLTLVVPSITGKPVQIARNTLTDLWGPKLKSNELDALITRVSDEVMTLK